MRKIKLVIIFIIIFLAGFLIANGIKYYLDMWKADRNVQAWQKGIDDIFANDTYGGATPEETFDLYLAALKKGDLELASKYYFFTKQQKELESLKNLQTKGELDAYIQKLENAKIIWIKKENETYNWQNRAAYEYEGELKQDLVDTSLGVEIKFEAGKYNSLIEFSKNGTVWKLL